MNTPIPVPENPAHQNPTENSPAQLNPLIAAARPVHITPELVALLRSVSIFSTLSDEQLKCFDSALELRLDAGDVLLRPGQYAGHFVILLAGRVSIFTSFNGRPAEEVISYSGGTAFGELPLLSNQPVGGEVRISEPTHVLLLDEEAFWRLMTMCPGVRKAILGNMAQRFQGFQNRAVHQEKMASLGTLAAGLMHELNNPGAAAKRAASQLRQNLQRMHEVGAKLSQSKLTEEQRECMVELKSYAMAAKKPVRMNSLEQSDAEEDLALWMENAHIENAWKLAPTLVSIGMTHEHLACARSEFPAEVFSDCLSWLEALVSSMQLVGMIEESIGRVTDLVHAVKSYAYEGKGARQSINVNDSIHATLVILAHKMREKQIAINKEFAADLPLLYTELAGLNQVWTNLLDNAIDAVGPHGNIHVRTWSEFRSETPFIFISIADDGTGIPLDVQPRIFDPFYTTKEVGVGTGLGLGIVSRIVDQFGGTIRFTSEPGHTEFIVTLPASRSTR